MLTDEFGDGGDYNKEDLKQNLYLKCNVCNNLNNEVGGIIKH